MSRAEFLSSSPCELYLLFEADADLERDGYGPAAHIQALLANIYRDEDKRDEPYTPAEFMPGAAVKSEHESLIEWAEAVLSGETFEAPDIEELEQRRRTIKKTFSNVLST